MGSCKVKRSSITLFHPFCGACSDVMRLSPLRTYIRPHRMMNDHLPVSSRTRMSRLLVKAICFFFLVFTSTAIGGTVVVPHSSGTIPFTYQGQTYSTWYTYQGRWGSHRPLIVLHGGPGLSHDYTIPLADLSTTRPVIFYDQIGIARSSNLTDKPQSFFTVDLYLSELKNVIAFFNLKNYDILGHSWGGMLAAEYAVLQPAGLRNLVLTDSPTSMSLWIQSQSSLLSTFPQDVQQGVLVGFSDPPVYRAALGEFFGKYGCNVKPWPLPLNISFDYLFADPTVSINM